jgi:ABC-type transporter Mla maintaining outer membrane lipid asymmetry permease subunit MlaE
MTFELPKPKGPAHDLAIQVGALVGFSLETLVATARVLFRRRLSLGETVTQSLFIAKVCSGPALLLMLPVGVLIAVSVGSLAGQLGAGAYSGAIVSFVVVGQAAALVCALMLAGVGGSAICADLGSRTIREEIEAMEVMGLNVIERLVVPRLLASVLVSLMLCSLVTLVGCAPARSIEETTFASQLHVDLSASKKLASGLYLQDLTVGTGDEAVVGHKVTMRYTGWLADGTQFDSNQTDGFQFTLGAGEVITGWDQGVPGMKVGGRRQLTIPAHLAYGNQSPTPAIKPGETLIFVVDLLGV